jgi:ABC-type uncharacterized transport system permease subunit
MILASASPVSIIVALAAAVAYAVPALAGARLSVTAAWRALLAAWLLHALALLAEALTGPVRFGFGPALSVTAWLALTVYGVERRMFPQLKARWALSGLGALVVLVALAFPGAALHVSASPWLPLHWALGIASYGMFAAAVLHAGLMRRAEKQIRLAADPHSGIPLLTLERLTFHFVGAGFALLTATLLAGWWFGAELYGAAGARWKWDHKIAFSLLSWLTFAMLLVGRSRWGWRGRRAVQVLYTGAGLLLLAYAGSRFVLEVLLRRVA